MRSSVLVRVFVPEIVLVTAFLALPVLLASCQRRPAGPVATKAPPGERLVIEARARGVKDERVLGAIAAVPREEFLPPDQRSHASEDRSLPIWHGQRISQPSLVALMTELLDVTRSDRVLEIGTGSGYQAAILAELTPYVYTIEIIPELAKKARAVLTRLGYTTVKVKTGDGYQGWPEFAPFDAIVVTCAPDHVPKPLVEQLREGGRMVIPVGPATGPQRLYLFEKRGGKLVSTEVVSVRFVPLVR